MNQIKQEFKNAYIIIKVLAILSVIGLVIQLKDSMESIINNNYQSEIFLFRSIIILLNLKLFQNNHTIYYQQQLTSFPINIKEKSSYKQQVSTNNINNSITSIIFKGNFVSMYQLPIYNETISVIKNGDKQDIQSSINTGEQGEFELTYQLTEKDFQNQPTTNTIILALYVDISEQLIKEFPFIITKDFLVSSSIVFEFNNKVLEQNSKVQTFINGSIEDKETLKSIASAKVEVIYFFPMTMARKEVITNKVGYFEFKLELDYFEVIIADIIVSKDGYKSYKASEDPRFINDKGIPLYDNYQFQFSKSIKLDEIQQ